MASLSYFEANRAAMAAFLPMRYDRILEVGCASGGFAQYLRDGSEVWGVEPHVGAAFVARTKLTRVLTGTYEEAASDLPNNYFDVVVCNDVIEHMVDHDRFLEIIKSKLKPGGCIVGSIPNVRHITALFKLLILKDWQYSDSGILDRTHLRFFTARSERRTFAEHGWKLEEFRGLGSIILHGLHSDARPPSLVQNIIYRSISLLVVLGSLGFYADTQFPQFGFRIRLQP